MSISFDRDLKTVSLSMPGYVTKMLQRFRPQYLLPGQRPVKTPSRYIAPSYTSAPQVVFIDKSEKLSPTLITELQAVIGTLLYYARAVDPTLLTISNELGEPLVMSGGNSKRPKQGCATFSLAFQPKSVTEQRKIMRKRAQNKWQPGGEEDGPCQMLPRLILTHGSVSLACAS
jgi:hypothetical protein